MLCVSAIIAVVRCPSVTLVHCIHTAEVIVKLLARPGRAIILVFCSQASVLNSKENPFSGGAKYMGVGNCFAIFD